MGWSVLGVGYAVHDLGWVWARALGWVWDGCLLGMVMAMGCEVIGTGIPGPWVGLVRPGHSGAGLWPGFGCGLGSWLHCPVKPLYQAWLETSLQPLYQSDVKAPKYQLQHSSMLGSIYPFYKPHVEGIHHLYTPT
jgi:hypothetical protein